MEPSDLDSNYWVVVKGKCNSDTARDFTIMMPDIVITSEPSNVQLCEGETATFSVEASIVGGTSIAYQWEKDGQILSDNSRIAGTNTNTLQISNVSITDAGVYNVEITNLPSGFVKSSAPATLTVDVKPTITQQPLATINLNVGEALNLSVDVDGTQPMNYQWYKDGDPISGATNSSYTKSNVTSDDAGVYYCVINNICGVAKSSDAVVTVTFKVIAGDVIDVSNSANILLASPNPFSESITIIFNSKEIDYGRMTITDAMGNEVANLFEGRLGIGANQVTFTPSNFNLGSGVYFCRLILSSGKQLSTQLLYIK